MSKFSQQLGKYIESSGLKQIHIASKAGISYNYLQRLLSGNRNPSDQVVCKLAETLRLSLQQTGELLVAAGYAPPTDLLSSTSEEDKNEVSPHPPIPTNEVTRIAQQFYKLAWEIPEELQSTFLEEMRHLLGYARYKYVLSGSTDVLELTHFLSRNRFTSEVDGITQPERSSLNLIAQIIGELQDEPDNEYMLSSKEASQPPQAIEDMLSAIDQLIGNLLAGGISAGNFQLEVIVQMLEMLRDGTPWEIRRRIVEALPSLFKLDVIVSEPLLEMLRVDIDERRGVDIRRRVIESLPTLFQVSPQHLPIILRLLRSKVGDDIYVALATIEVCGDIQDRIKQSLKKTREALTPTESLTTLLHQSQAEISKIQRQLLMSWEGIEKESLQFSMALHSLLSDPETLLISLHEGLQSPEKLMQLAAARYLEQVLPSRSLETLELYKVLLSITKQRNVRRTVAKALPRLLQYLKEASLPSRALVRDIISNLAVDSDIYIRRAVADHAMQILQVDREFLLVLLRLMHKDTDRVIRHRLQPVALCLAQVWLIWYAETAGLIDAKQQRNKAVTSFGE